MFLYYLLIGAILGFVYERSGALAVPIVLHFALDAFTILWTWALRPLDLQMAPGHHGAWLTFAAVAVGAGLVAVGWALPRIRGTATRHAAKRNETSMTRHAGMPTIHVDFHNADTEGYVRLNTAGAINDLSRLGVSLSSGLQLCASDGEIMMVGVVREPGPEGVWRLQVDWKQVFAEHARLE